MEPIGRIRRAVTRRPLVSSLVGVLALATAVSVPVAAASGGGGANASVAMVGYAPAIPSAAVRTGAVAPATSIRFEFLLRLPDAASLQAFATGVSTPGSPLFHHYLARGEVGRRFGPTSATVSAVSAGLRKLGLTPGWVSPDHLLVAVTAPAAKIESALRTQLVHYRLPNGHVGFANASTPMLPVSIAHDVTTVVGLDTVAQWHPELARVRSKSSSKRAERSSVSSAPAPSSGAASPLVAASTARSSVRPDLASPDTAGPTPCSTASTDAGNSGTYTADQIASAYGHNTLYGRGDLGSGETIGIFSFQSYIANEIN